VVNGVVSNEIRRIITVRRVLRVSAEVSAEVDAAPETRDILTILTKD